MSYTVTNFRTKKALKEAVAADTTHNPMNSTNNKPVRCFNPGLGPDLSNYTGTVYLEGPHYPKPHSWYAEAQLVNGVVVKVK
jgi:hypothetical protein